MTSPRRVPVDSTDEVGVVAAALNEMLDRLQSAFDSQQQFLDDAGHELRTPITIVRGHLELLDDEPEQRAADIALVLDELDRMDRLVRDLRVHRPLGPPRLPRVGGPRRGRAGRGRRPPGRRHGRPRLAGRAPDAVVVRGDRHRLTEALLNLVDNAIDATGPADVIEIGAEVGGTGADAALELWVRDEGRGLDASEAARLFQRGEVAPRRHGGPAARASASRSSPASPPPTAGRSRPTAARAGARACGMRLPLAVGARA